MNLSWSTEKRKISDLKPYFKNPRKLTNEQFQKLKESLEKFDYVEVAAINADNTILAGHMRLKVLEKLHGKKHEVDVRVPSRALDEKEVEEYVIRSNKNTGEWDFDILANQFDISELVDWGFNIEDFDIELPAEEIVSEDEEDACLEPPKDPKTKAGDIYQLGDHRLMCGDSTNPDNVFALLNGDEPILMVTDPPYGVNYDPSWRKDIKGKAGVGAKALGKVSNDDKVDWSLAWSLFPGSAAYVWHAGKYCSDVQTSLENAEFEIISQIIWIKTALCTFSRRLSLAT